MISVNSQTGLSEKVIDQLSQVFKNHKNVEKVILYGSRAKGKHLKGSDIDLTIKGPDISLTQLMRIENEIEELFLPYKIDLSCFDNIENQDLVDHINRVGILLYKTDI